MLAIITPVHNCVDYTRQAIESIKTKEKFVLIVINNESTDGTKEYLDEVKRAGKIKIEVIEHYPQKGVAESWNAGVRLAQSYKECDKYLIINNDIIFHPECIDKLCKYSQKYDLVSGNDMMAEIPNPVDILTYKNDKTGNASPHPHFSCFMLTKKSIQKLASKDEKDGRHEEGLFDEGFQRAYFEDNDYHHRMRLAGLSAVAIEDCLFYHFGSRTIKQSSDVAQAANRTFEANKEYFKTKWGATPEALNATTEHHEPGTA